MATYAEIDSNNKVIRLIEAHSKTWCDEMFGGVWVETKEGIRNKVAAVGDDYDSTNDVFISPKPYPSWKMSNVGYDWKPPKPHPGTESGTLYVWNEEILNWEIPNDYIN